MENAFGNRIATFLLQWRIALLALGVIVAIASWPLAQRLHLDWQLDRMFAPGDPLVESYHRLEERFGGNEVVIAVYRDAGLWSESGEGLARLTTISERLSKVEGVAAVLSLAELHRILERMRAPLKVFRLGQAAEVLRHCWTRKINSPKPCSKFSRGTHTNAIATTLPWPACSRHRPATAPTSTKAPSQNLRVLFNRLKRRPNQVSSPANQSWSSKVFN